MQEKGLYRNILTKHAGVALVKKILLDAKDELGLYKKAINKLGFAEKVFETIQLYKSCRISPEQLHTEYKNTLLSAKLRDLKIIYQKYEEALSGEYTDNFNLLNIFISVLSFIWFFNIYPIFFYCLFTSCECKGVVGNIFCNC